MRFPEIRTLVQAAKEQTNASSQMDLAAKLRQTYGGKANASQISRYENGKTMRFDMAMMLLHAAGWLNTEAVQAALQDEDERNALEAAHAAEDLAARAERAQGKRRRGQEG